MHFGWRDHPIRALSSTRVPKISTQKDILVSINHETKSTPNHNHIYALKSYFCLFLMLLWFPLYVVHVCVRIKGSLFFHLGPQTLPSPPPAYL